MAAQADVRGCWDIRGRDCETILAGRITDTIISADWIVRAEHRNGFPNWDLYRVAVAGDSLKLSSLRQWCVCFSIAYCLAGGIKRKTFTEELATVAAWDALYLLIYGQQMQPYTVTAEGLGVDHKTYRRLRAALYARLAAALDEYMVRMNVALREVYKYERKSGLE